MRFGNSLKIVFAFVGTFIGAGFASGREIALFFGGANLIVPVLSVVFCGAMAYIFLELGRISEGEPLKAIFPKTSKVWEILLAGANFAVFAAMLAGAEYIIKDALGFAGGGILSGIFAAAIVLGGVEKIKNLNTAIVPLIAAMILFIFFNVSGYEKSLGAFGLISPLLYAAMNMLSCGLLTAKLAKDITKKESLFCAAAVAVLLAMLILPVYLSIRGLEDEAMPLLVVAKSLHLEWIGSILVYLAILTTMAGALSLASSDKPIPVLLLLGAGWIAAIFGFTAIVNTVYPVIGVLGAALSCAGLVRLLFVRFKKRRVEISLRG
jgi:uncharacterized membrane protein YkvI